MIGACPEPVLAVGRDCECGHPLVWMRGVQRCAVWGTHPAPDAAVHFRNLRAPGAALVALSMATPTDTQWSRRNRERRARLRAVS